MEDATIIEQDTSNIQPEVTQDATIVEQPTVVEQATPMDANTTYDNLPKDDIKYDPTKDMAQNIVQDAMHLSHDENVISTSGNAMNRFLTKDYNYDREEAGSYWVAGGINDKDTQMAFLNTIINEEMYDEMDLQKYYYDTTMATARAYAAQKEKETAYGYYRAAQEKAIAEAQLTGWYMPAEGQYMLANYEAAQTTLKDPNADDASKAKANRISGVAEQWFAANKISTRGMKCLSMMNYEENIRHNTIMGELQKQANAIAAKQAGASAASANLQLRQLKFQLEEYEMQSGHNITKEIGLDNDNVLGHKLSDYPDYQGLQGFEGDANTNALTKILTESNDYYSAILSAKGKTWLDDVLKKNGKDPQEFYNKYQANLGDTGLKESYANNGNILDESYLNQTKWKIDKAGKEENGKEIYAFHSTDNGKPVTRCYWKDGNGVYHQITDNSISIGGNKTLSDVVNNFTSNKLEYNGEGINVGNKFNRSDLPGSYTNTIHNNLTKKQMSTIKEKESQGYYVLDGYTSTKGINTGIIMQDAEGKYYEVEHDGKFQEISDKNKIRQITISGKEGQVVFTTVPREHVEATFVEKDLNGGVHDILVHSSDAESQLQELPGGVKSYTNPDGSVIYLQAEEDNHGTRMKIISTAKAADISGLSEEQLNKFTTAKDNYRAGYIETKAGKNADTIERENSEALKQKVTELLNNNSSNVSTVNGGSTTKSSNEQENTVDIHDPQIEKIIVEMKDTPDFKDLSDEEIIKKIEENQNYYGEFLNQFK